MILTKLTQSIPDEPQIDGPHQSCCGQNSVLVGYSPRALCLAAGRAGEVPLALQMLDRTAFTFVRRRASIDRAVCTRGWSASISRCLALLASTPAAPFTFVPSQVSQWLLEEGIEMWMHEKGHKGV